jgi:hypothetical protein
MAERLIEEWQLAVLRARLDVTEWLPVVITELVSYRDGTPQQLWAMRHPLSAFGLSDSSAAPDGLGLPDDLRDEVADSLRTDLRGEASLWIRLVAPYGYLGAVPWEKSLLDVVDVPIFRVPDRLPLAADPGRRWSVAIGISAAPDAEWPAPYLRDLVEQLAENVGQDVEVDVFADAATHARLLRLGWTPPAWAHVHMPGGAREASAARVRRLMSSSYGSPGSPAPIDVTSPGRIWADWISTGLAGRAVRALHVALDAVWDVEAPLLALSPDPSKPQDTDACAFVAADDVRRLADAVGAATLSLGSPPDVTSGAAMRMIADSIGLQRPGATIHSSIEHDPHGEALARLHGFLAGQSRDRLPRDRSLFAYVQPEQVQTSLATAWPQPPPTAQPDAPPAAEDELLRAATLPGTYRPAPEDDLVSYYAEAGNVPSWVGASERYVGQQVADLTRSQDAAPKSPGSKNAYELGAAEGLAELQAIIAKHAKPS